MYRWLVFLHVLGVFGFLLAHGASASIAFALRRERRLAQVQALLALSAASYPVMYLSLLLLLLTGIIAGFGGRWWGRGWIWVSLALLIAMVAAMGLFGSRVYGEARKLAGLPFREGNRERPPLPPAGAAELDAVLRRGNPTLLSAIGLGGIALIAWLMMFKPF